MDVREKLVELICNVQDYGTKQTYEERSVTIESKNNETVADHLIAHGVTVQSEVDANTYQLMRECERLKEEKERFANAVNVLEEINSDLYKKLKGLTVQEWISVKDRLPEKDGLYLIFTTQYFTPDHIDEIDHIDGIEISGYYKKYGFSSTGGIYAKYWMPLPQPPKGE